MPFMDGTCGEATYSGGRYLDLIELGYGRTVVDCNYAYNPYCAYNPHWCCPIQPPENRLTIPIEAGETAFPGAKFGMTHENVSHWFGGPAFFSNIVQW